jgi:hypothetical protein
MGWFVDGIDGLTDEFVTKKCSDGSKRYILKDPRHLPIIFDHYFVEWKLKVKAALKISKDTANANVGTEVGKKAQQTHDEISNMDRNAFAKYAIAYVTYTTEPCGNTKFLTEISTTIINQMDKLDAQVKDLNAITEVAVSDVVDGSSSDPRIAMLDLVNENILEIHSYFGL